MAKIIIFIFISLYIFSSGQYESDIVEGTKTYNVVKGSTYNFIFKAIDNGTYVIIFPQHFQLLEATGEIHEDVDIDSGFYSLVYAQKFVKGDYIKLEYPKLTVIEKTSTMKIKIEKIDAYFKLKTISNPVIFTMAVNDCQKPIYIFTYNNQAESYSNYFTFYGKIHSGEFIGSYRTTEFNPDGSLNKDFKDLTVSSATALPRLIYLNIVKLQCTEPGLISIYMENDPFYSFTDEIGLMGYKSGITYRESFSNANLPANAYIQVFNLIGSTSIDLTQIGGRKYNNDFYTKINLLSSYSTKTFDFPVQNLDSYTMILSIFNIGESTDKIATEKENILVLPNKRIIIPLKIITDKKHIKITSSIKGFYWEYQYSQTDDINYLPKIGYDSKNFQKGNVTFIDNPYKYKKLKTDYKMFISITHNNNEGVIFNYEYTNGNENENNNGNENGNNNGNDNGKNENYNSSSKAWIWIIIIIVIIIIAFIAWYFYRKKKMESISNINNQNFESLMTE